MAVLEQVVLDRAGGREQIRGIDNGTTTLLAKSAGLCPSVPVSTGWAALRRTATLVGAGIGPPIRGLGST